MSKFGNWILDHLKLVVTILVFTVTLVVIGLVMLTSYVSYKGYEARFKQNDLDIRSLSPAQPTSTEIVDKFKSENGKKFVFNAQDLTVKPGKVDNQEYQDYLIGDYIDLTPSGGTIEASLSLEKKAFVDIVFTISSDYSVKENEEDKYGIEDLLSNVSFVVNGERMEDVVDLPDQDWHQLVMSGFALPEGPVKVTISNETNKNAMMPKLQSIVFFSSQPLSLLEAE